MEAVLEAEDLSYSYEGGEFTVSLPRLELGKGGITALTGVSGSGKSTLLECLGLLRPVTRARRFEAAGFDMLALHGRRQHLLRSSLMGFMPQQGGLIPFLTVRENLEAAFDLAAASMAKAGLEIPRRRGAMEEARQMCRSLGIEELMDRYPKELSQGQAQRASFVRATVHSPRILFVDEPTSALDPPRALELFKKMAELVSGKGLAALVVTHDTALADQCGFERCAYDRAQSSADRSVFTYLGDRTAQGRADGAESGQWRRG
ncbi:MAG: ABC transporter ATP-binding protein [Succinivibrio sp.]